MKRLVLKEILKNWIAAKTIITILLLAYGSYIYFFAGTLVTDEENELLVIELSVYTISTVLLVYFFSRMYDAMKLVIIFDFIFLLFFAYCFRMNYIILLLDLITVILIILDHNDMKNFIKRRLRKINIHLHH